MFFEMIIFLAFFSDCVNVNSHSGIYDAAGNLRQSLQLVQGEWNILRMGNPKYIGQCKVVRFKTIYIESLDTSASIPLMTDGIINQNMDTTVDYVSSKLTSYRSFSHDAILIYGFGMKDSQNGAVKAKMSIKDGLSDWGSWSDCSKTCDTGSQTRTRICAYDPDNFSQSLTETKSCYIQECCNDWTSWSKCCNGSQTRSRVCPSGQKNEQQTCQETMALAYMRLDVTASCSSSHEVQVISGTYVAAGVFNDRIIYQKTVQDVNLQWWSLRYDKPTEDPRFNSAYDRWIFSYQGQQVTQGQSSFGSIIENCRYRQGFGTSDTAIRETQDCTFSIVHSQYDD